MNPLSPSLIQTIKRSRFNPIRTLTPASLSNQLDSFAAGQLRDFAITAQAIARRDDVIVVALPKRMKATSRRPYAIQILDGLSDAQKPRAAEHQAALQYFWDNARAADAIERNVSGGFKLLVRQMMNAVGLAYACHEITWRPAVVEGRDRLTATFTHVPLQFFENTTGKLRFCRDYLGQVEGEEMPDLGWMVTVGEGILEALSVCYMFKQLSLKDWVSYNERFGTPGVLGKTDAAKGTDSWTIMEEAVASFSADWSAVVNTGASIDLVTASGGASLPFPSLVERMDRAIATICRGADLSTMSAGEGSGQGASLQGDESDLLEQDDAEMISETLQRIDRIVIAQLFGEEPLAYVQVQVPKRADNADTRANLTFLRDSGVPVSQQYAREQLSVPAPAKDEPLLVAPAQPAALPGMLPRAFANANAQGVQTQLVDNTADAAGRALLAKSKGVLAELRRAAESGDDATYDAAMKKAREQIRANGRALGLGPEDPLVVAIFRGLSAAVINGAAAATEARKA